jgi:hypothetical protein
MDKKNVQKRKGKILLGKKHCKKWAESIKVRIAIIKILVCDDEFFSVFAEKYLGI